MSLSDKVFMFGISAGDAINNGAGRACNGNCGSGDIGGIFAVITNTLIYLIGAISVIMVIVGGLRYVLSNGDPKAAEGGRNTILYAVIGIVVSLMAYAIVNFVVKAF